MNEKLNIFMNDRQIREVLRKTILAPYVQDPDSLVLDELGLRHGRVRVDIAVVNGAIHGYEIKSDRDRLDRLPEQVRVYGSVLDYATLVVGGRHVQRALPLLPDWWGVEVAQFRSCGGLEICTLRDSQPNPSADAIAVAKLLWRCEALSLLEALDSAAGVRSKPRAEIYARLAEATSLDWLRASVRCQLKSRTGWRVHAKL